MRHQYTPVFREFTTSSMWAESPATRCVWLYLMLHADPEGFREVARAMAERAAALLAAAKQRNAVAVGDLASGLDQECTSCHVRYWYLQAE